MNCIAGIANRMSVHNNTKGKLTKRRKGVPQGSPLSPLLSQIMLHELDEYMERQGLKYVRYVDDFSIYTKSKGKARKASNDVYLFLKQRQSPKKGTW